MQMAKLQNFQFTPYHLKLIGYLKKEGIAEDILRCGRDYKLKFSKISIPTDSKHESPTVNFRNKYYFKFMIDYFKFVINCCEESDDFDSRYKIKLNSKYIEMDRNAVDMFKSGWRNLEEVLYSDTSALNL